MRRDGFVLAMVLGMSVLIGVILMVSSTFAIASRRTVSAEAQKIPAFYAANAGLERAMAKIASLIVPSQVIAGSSTEYKDATVDAVAVDLAARLNSTGQLANSSGSVSGGAFRVTATAKGGGTVELKSDGVGTGGGQRTILLSYLIKASTLKAQAGGALTSTGAATISGNSPVQGTTGAVATSGFTVGCTISGTACASQSSPAVYSITVPNTGEPLPALNDNVTYLPDPVSDPTYAMGDVLYKVTKVDPLTREVQLTAINETVKVTTGTGSRKRITEQPAPLTSGAKLATTTEVAAILTYKANTTTNGNTASATCQTYSCGFMTTTPDKLFEATFGVTKEQFKSDLSDPLYNAHRFLTGDECSSVAGGSTVQWLSPNVNASGTVNLVDCNTPRILIIDMPRVNNGMTLNLNNGVFKGLLYIIANDQSVKIDGNAGAFDGAVIVETGTGTATNPSFTLNGTAKSDVCPVGATSVVAKICYDPVVLNGLLTQLKANLTSSALPSVSDLANSWTEKGN